MERKRIIAVKTFSLMKEKEEFIMFKEFVIEFNEIEDVDYWRKRVIEKIGVSPKITARIIKGKHVFRGYIPSV